MLSRLSTKSILAVLASAIFGRAATALSQVIAAFYLDSRQFGIYATGTGVLTITGILRGGGSGNHLLSVRPEEFREDGGRFLRYGSTFALATLLLTVVLAWPVAGAFASAKGYEASTEGELRTVILLLGAAMTVAIIGQYPRARMASSLRFGELSLVDTISGSLKLGSTVVLAATGFGAVALAMPLLLISLFENLWTWPRCRMSRGEWSAPSAWFTRTLLEMRLPMVVAILATINMQADSLIGSVMLPVQVIGFYYFASQLAAQPAMLVANSLRSMVSPAAAAVRGDAVRERATIRDAFSVGIVFAPLASMAVPAVFDALDRAVFNGKWSDARWGVFILSLSLAFPTVVQLLAAPFAGIRDWGATIRLDAGRAFAKVVGAAVGSLFIVWLKLDDQSSVNMLAVFIGTSSLLISSAEIFRVLRAAEMSAATISYELYSTPLAATLSALAASGLAHSLAEPIKAAAPDRVGAFAELGLAAVLYTLLSLTLLRFGYTAALEKFVGSLPAVLAQPVRRALFLTPESAK